MKPNSTQPVNQHKATQMKMQTERALQTEGTLSQTVPPSNSAAAQSMHCWRCAAFRVVLNRVTPQWTHSNNTAKESFLSVYESCCGKANLFSLFKTFNLWKLQQGWVSHYDPTNAGLCGSLTAVALYWKSSHCKYVNRWKHILSE